MSVGTFETAYKLEAYKNPDLITLFFERLSWLISWPSESDGKTADHSNNFTTRDSFKLKNFYNNRKKTKNKQFIKVKILQFIKKKTKEGGGVICMTQELVFKRLCLDTAATPKLCSTPLGLDKDNGAI